MNCPAWLLKAKEAYNMPDIIPLKKTSKYGWTEISGMDMVVCEGDAMAKSFENSNDIRPFEEMHSWRITDFQVRNKVKINTWQFDSGIRHFRHVLSPWWNKNYKGEAEIPLPARRRLPGNAYFARPLPLP
jgi:hypothetical protein